jgi:hypothetical protein
MEYTIIETTSRTLLIMEVERHINKGWIPQGGVSCFENPRSIPKQHYYVQAMIKVK